MNAIERQVNEINRLYEKIRETKNDSIRRKMYQRLVKELEDDLLEYCAWRKLDYAKICKGIFK